MCQECDWDGYVAEISSALDKIHDIPEAGQEFAEGVDEKLRSIQSWAEDNSHITEAQKAAVDNIIHGIDKWVEGGWG